MKTKFGRGLAVLALLITMSSSASAALLTYTAGMAGFDYDSASHSPAYLAALGVPVTHISFNGAASTNGASYSSDVTFSTKTGAFGGSNTPNVNASNEIGPSGSWDGTLNIDFLANGNTVSGVGFGLVLFDSSQETVRVYDDTDTLIGTYNNALGSQFSFWGVTASGGQRIGRVELDGNFFAIQDITFNTEGRQDGHVPEPESLALVGIALVGLAAMRRRKQRNAAR
jgi:hypothetical protein